MRTLLIDADSLVYQSCTANEVVTQWDEDLFTLHAFLEPTVAHFEEAVAELLKKLEGDRVVMALSDYTNPWRKEIMPSYKANRNGTRKPVTYAALRQYIHEHHQTFQKPGLEGDDVLGILLTNPKLFAGDTKILVSLDKDMKTLPGRHYNMGKQQLFEITPPEADYNHMLQTLTGDTVDGYPGCPKVGPVSGAKILDEYTLDKDSELIHFDLAGAWAAVVRAYEKAGQSDWQALLNARVARICRYRDYDYVKKEVILWEPPKTTD